MSKCEKKVEEICLEIEYNVEKEKRAKKLTELIDNNHLEDIQNKTWKLKEDLLNLRIVLLKTLYQIQVRMWED